MSDKQPQKWLLKIVPDAKIAFDRLKPAQKRAIFHAMEQILNTDDPYLLPFVAKIKDKRFDGLRKFAVGNYRVYFRAVSEEIKHQKHNYKGTVLIITIVNRRDAY